MRSSLRIQLVLGTWLLLVVAFLPPFFYFGQTLRGDIFDEAYTRSREVMNSARWMLQREQGLMDIPRLTEWAREFTDNTGARFSYIINGKVFVDTQMTAQELSEFNDHSLRPEIMAANAKGSGIAMRYSTTIERYYVYIAEPVQGVDGLHGGIVRIALPVQEQYMHFSRLETGLLVAFFFSLIGSGLLGIFITRPVLASIEDLACTTQAIGQGDYARRIRASLPRELRPLAHAINGMAHNIESHFYSLEEQRGRLEAVFNGMCEGVMVLDVHGNITSINKALTSMFPNMANIPITGHTPLEATMRPRLQQAVDRVRAQSTMEPQTILLECSGERVFEVSLVPFTDLSGATVDLPHRTLEVSGRSVVLVFHDVSEKEKLERMRRDFVANVSHELKTPLTSIKGYSETLLELPDQPSPQRTLFLETIARNADHMTKMVSSLLTLAKSEHQGEQKNLPIIDACMVLDDCFDAMQPAAIAKSIEILADYDEGLLLRADHDGLSEVFRNLLDNAIKYSPVGSHIRLMAEPQPSSILFRIEDQGAGIPEKSKDRIFERFYRLEGESSKDGSAGLGLAICRRIVKSYSGDIWVESPIDIDNGKGAAFLVSIPSVSEDV